MKHTMKISVSASNKNEAKAIVKKDFGHLSNFVIISVKYVDSWEYYQVTFTYEN